MTRKAPALAAILFLVACKTSPDQDPLNGSFEAGREGPTGWELSGGAGVWEEEGHTGARCISATGDGESSNYWKCASFPLEQWTIYRVEFWTKSSPDASGGNVITGTNQCNFDWPHAKDWTHRSITFRTTYRHDRAYLRFGQWQAKGKVYFDDIRIKEVRALHGWPEGVYLGEGETIRNGRYEFVAPLNKGLNWARAIDWCTADFNSNRWLLTGETDIGFRHGVGRRGMGRFLFSDAQVEVNVGHYTAGRCVIQASLDEKTWTRLGEIAEVGTAEFRLPSDFDGPRSIFVRLHCRNKEGEAKPCSLQINDYRFSARIDKKDINLTGTTYFVHQEPADWSSQEEWDRLRREWTGPRKTLALLKDIKTVGAPSLGGLNTVQIGVANGWIRTLRIVPVVEIDGARTSHPYYEIPRHGEATIIVPYHAGRPGNHKAKVKLLDGETSETLYTATWDYRVPPLYDSGFGYAIASDADCDLWWAEAPYKISRRCPTPEKRRPIMIAAAKGEYEPLQLVIAPKRDLRGLRVKVSALRSAGSGRIPADAIEVCRVGYVSVTHPTDSIGCAGEWPDPLPPLDKPFDVVAKKGVQPLWLTVHVPRDAAAGDYRGTIDLAAENWQASVPFTVRVWDFEIPRENHLKTAFGFSHGNVRRYHNLTSDEELRQVLDLYFKNFAEHRISPYNFAPFDPIRVEFPETPDGSVKLDFSRFDRQAEKYFGPDYRFTTLRLPLRGMGSGTFHARRPGRIGGFEQGSPEYERIFADYLRQLESHFRQKGWLDKVFIYWFDEPDPKDYEFVRDGMERIHRAAPGLRRMLTEQPEDELAEVVEIWCPVTPNVKPEDVARERAKGREFWWYICTGPKGPYCTLFIDHYAIEFRMWSWQTWKTGVQGLLIWASNYWTSSAAFPSPAIQNPWEDPMSYRSGYSTPKGVKRHWGNGDGRFLYPPNRDPANDKSKHLGGPINSFRWEMLREGIEDYEYFWLLRDLVEKAKKRGDSGEAVARGERLLRIPDSITRDLTHFTHDPLDLYRYRAALAEAIVALSGSK